LTGAIVEDGVAFIATGIYGKCRISSTDEREANLLRALFAKMDGKTPWSDLSSGLSATQLSDLVRALSEIGALIPDSSLAWEWFDQLCRNPSQFESPMSDTEAYSLPVPDQFLQGGTTGIQDFPYVSDHQQVRDRSRSLELDRIDPDSSYRTAARSISIGSEAVRLQDDGHPYYSSAGAFYPVRLVAFIPAGTTYELWEFQSHRASLRRTSSTIPTGQIAACFIQQDDLKSAIAGLPTIFVLIADITRSNAKYGNRAWSFAQIEAGQILCRIELLANKQGLKSRAIGGICESQLQVLMQSPQCIPIVSIFISAEIAK
jgi:hypothetical protein